MTDHPRNGNGAMDDQNRIEAELRERFNPEQVYDLMVHVAAGNEMVLRKLEALEERVSEVERNGCTRGCSRLEACQG
jgi:hypothetical protein